MCQEHTKSSIHYFWEQLNGIDIQKWREEEDEEIDWAPTAMSLRETGSQQLGERWKG